MNPLLMNPLLRPACNKISLTSRFCIQRSLSASAAPPPRFPRGLHCPDRQPPPPTPTPDPPAPPHLASGDSLFARLIPGYSSLGKAWFTLGSFAAGALRPIRSRCKGPKGTVHLLEHASFFGGRPPFWLGALHRCWGAHHAASVGYYPVQARVSFGGCAYSGACLWLAYFSGTASGALFEMPASDGQPVLFT